MHISYAVLELLDNVRTEFRTDREAETLTDRLTNRETDRLTNRQTGRQTDKQTDKAKLLVLFLQLLVLKEPTKWSSFFQL